MFYIIENISFAEHSTSTSEKRIINEKENAFFRKYGIPQYNYNNQLYIIGFVGNDDALEHHLEQYNELGFTNDRIIIFERQLSTYNALKRKLETLKISKKPIIIHDEFDLNKFKSILINMNIIY